MFRYLAALSAILITSVVTAGAVPPEPLPSDGARPELPPITKSHVRPPNLFGPRTIAPNKLTSAQAMARLNADHDIFFQNARQEVYRGAREILAQDVDEIDKKLKYRKMIHGNLKGKEIALTFDDGPHPAYTPAILEILRREHIPATFFLVGSQAEKYPELVRAELAAGHSVANHTYHHVSLPKIPQLFVADEIKACGDVLKAVTGKPPRLFRPPGGEYNRSVAEAAAALGYTMVLWTDDPGDYASPGEDVILQRTLDKASDGGIILIHDGIQQTINVLPQMIETLKKQGYRFVTIDEMMKGNTKSVPVKPADSLRIAERP